MSTKKSILVATPVHTDQLNLHYVISLFKIINDSDSPFRVNVFWRRGSLINRCRNELVGYFLDENYDYIFFIDSDIVDFAEAFLKIANKYIELEKTMPLLILSAAYPIKYFNFDYIKKENNILDNDNWTQAMLNYNINTKSLAENDMSTFIKEAKNNNGIVDASSSGGGFMMCSRYVITEMIKKYPETSYTNFANAKLLPTKTYNLFHSFVCPVTNYYISEDYGFCYIFKAMGGNIKVDATVSLSHYGEQKFTGSVYESIMLREKKSETEDVNKKNDVSGNETNTIYID